MKEKDPSDKFLQENLELISETSARCYYQDSKDKILIASWKKDRSSSLDAQVFQQNALLFADMVATRRPNYVMVDCRHLEHQLTYEQQHWYVQQTRALWVKSTVKKLAFIFEANLAVQLGMEGIQDAAQQEGIPSIEYRIFENVEEAVNWVKG